MTSPIGAARWIEPFLQWLTPRRLRAQAIVLALCLWAVCGVDFSTHGLFDRAGNVKFQDFLPAYISARLIEQHHSDELYDPEAQSLQLKAILGGSTQIQVPYLYPPQIALLFVPLAGFSFPVAAWIWGTLGVAIYFACIYVISKCCENVSSKFSFTVLAALAYPPLFHSFVRGQLSPLVLLCFTAAFLAFRSHHDWIGGIALGFLIFKPQFLVGIPLILLLARHWKSLLGLILSASAQIALGGVLLGSAIMRVYFETMLTPSRWLGSAELSGAPIQMHSLRSFWVLLIPSKAIAFALYLITSLIAIGIAAAIWKSRAPFALRFSALMLTSVLVNPHLFIYDLLVLALPILLVVDWSLANRQNRFAPRLQVLSYLTFILPFFGPISRWTHVQVSVIAFAVLLWTLFCFETRGHILASSETTVV